MKINQSCISILPMFCLLLSACASPEEHENISLLNTNHLDHLFEQINLNDKEVGTIWIYSEAPDYHLVVDDDEGFTCVDDVARTLIFYCRQYTADPSEKGLQKILSLSEFLLSMQAENGYFYNFLLPGPQINKSHKNSLAIANWWSWRAFWALSEVGLLELAELTELQSRGRSAMERLLANMQGICTSPEEAQFFNGIATPACLVDLGADQVAVMMMGLTNLYFKTPTEPVKSLLLTLGDRLLEVQHGTAQTPPHHAFLSWRNYWHAWGNSQAYALLNAGRILQNQTFMEAGLNEVKYFYPYCLRKGFISGFSLAKENDQLVVEDIQPFSQIAYGVRPMIYASLEAYAITDDAAFAAFAGQLATWFFGNNPAGQIMYDPSTGRTFDGVGSAEKVNYNSGAESTIEGLLSLQAIEAVPAAKEVWESYIDKKK